MNPVRVPMEKAMLTLKLFVFALILSMQAGVSARTQAESADSAQARKFVRAFYDWYGPRCLRYVLTKDCMQIAKPKRALFEADLWRALVADDRAQQRVSGEIVGIDFDPFEGGQDPDTGYRVGAVTKKGPNYWAEVHGSMSDKMSHKPAVIAIVVRKGGRWYFENFYYPADAGVPGTDLRTVLKECARDRAHKPVK